MEDVSWVSGPTLEISSGSLSLDLMLDEVRDFEKTDPVKKTNILCPVCEKPESQQPTIFRDGLGCCDLCRKVQRGELSTHEADQIQDNLTKNS